MFYDILKEEYFLDVNTILPFLPCSGVCCTVNYSLHWTLSLTLVYSPIRSSQISLLCQSLDHCSLNPEGKKLLSPLL